MSLQNSFNAPSQRFSKSLELDRRDEYYNTLFFFSSFLRSPPSHTSVSGCLKGQLAVVVYHHYQCLHMNAQSLMYVSLSMSLSGTLYHPVLVSITSLRHQEGMSLGVWERDAKDREKKGVEEGREERRGEVLHFCWIKPWRGGSPGDDIPGRNGPVSLCSRRIPQEGREGEERERWESQQSAFWERKVCRSERMCSCGVRCVGMCVCVET